MTITINQINTGTALTIDGVIYFVTDYQHVKPGKGAAFVRVKLKNIKTGAVLDRTFRTADKLDEIELEEREFEYLYHADDLYYFMDHVSYEQVAVSQEILAGAEMFLLENLVVTALSHDHEVLKIILPTFINTEITETEPGIKGDSSRAGNKPAKIATGATILVPLFISVGDMIRIDTRTGQYVERVQK